MLPSRTCLKQLRAAIDTAKKKDEIDHLQGVRKELLVGFAALVLWRVCANVLEQEIIIQLH